jgi:hypothetical protein
MIPFLLQTIHKIRTLEPMRLSLLRLDSKLSLREVHNSLALLLQHTGCVLLGQTSSDGAGLLLSEVEGKVLLVLVEQTELSALVGVDDGQDLGDRLADIVAVRLLAMRPTSHFQLVRIVVHVRSGGRAIRIEAEVQRTSW